jgi:hypothetical protein
MSYIKGFEAELVKKLNDSVDDATFVRWVYEKMLQSYRNGITAGQKGETVTGIAGAARHLCHSLFRPAQLCLLRGESCIKSVPVTGFQVQTVCRRKCRI